MIDPLSVQVNHLKLSGNGHQLGMATGFIVKHADSYYLITNWHVLSGRKPADRQPIDSRGIIPDRIEISVVASDLQRAGTLTMDLLASNGERLWVQHPQQHNVDVAALKLEVNPDITGRSFDMGLADADLRPQVGMSAVIIGFPYGVTTFNNTFPVWKTGHIASEPGLPYNNRPAILIDATTRSGMSGSPVLVRSSGPYRARSSNTIMITSQQTTLFLGVYSGRLNYLTGDDSRLSSELGLVWRPETIHELLEGQTNRDI